MVQKQRKWRQLMKATIFTYLTLVCIMVADYEEQWAAEARKHESRQVELWQKTLTNSKTEPDRVRLDKLKLGLLYFAQRSRYERASADVPRLYQSLQDEMISIPGHAKFYRDEILKAQSEYSANLSNGALKNKYLKTRGLGFYVMSLLPSPETITVMGEFLSNDFIKPNPAEDKQPVDWSKVDLRKINYGDPDPPIYSNPWSASYTIMELGLREPPVPFSKSGLSGKKDVEATRAWWELVKAGKKDISFIGRPEIYRFTGDGSWEMVGKVDAGTVEKELAAKKEEWRLYRERMEKVNAQQDTQDTQPLQKREEHRKGATEMWIGASILLVLIFLIFGWSKIQKQKFQKS
jgi:hypothetical protein